MTYRATITLDDDAYAFLLAQAGKNRSGFINNLLRKEKQATLSKRLLKANLEEANEAGFKEELAVWNTTLTDGLNQ